MIKRRWQWRRRPPSLFSVPQSSRWAKRSHTVFFLPAHLNVNYSYQFGQIGHVKQKYYLIHKLTLSHSRTQKHTVTCIDCNETSPLTSLATQSFRFANWKCTFYFFLFFFIWNIFKLPTWYQWVWCWTCKVCIIGVREMGLFSKAKRVQWVNWWRTRTSFICEVVHRSEHRLVTIWASFFLEGSGSLRVYSHFFSLFFIQWSISQHLISLSASLHLSTFDKCLSFFPLWRRVVNTTTMINCYYDIIATVVTITTTVTNATYCKNYNCCPFSGTCL